MAASRGRLNGDTPGQHPETNGIEPSGNSRAPTRSTGTQAERSEQIRIHSFQIVRLQNHIEVIQNARKEEVEEMRHLRHAVHDAARSIVDLKSRLAQLSIEFHSRPSTARSSESGRSDRRPKDNPARRLSVAKSPQSLERQVRATSVVAGAVAGHLLGTRSTLPARRLYGSSQLSQSLSPTTKNQLEELDQRPFYDAQESLTNSSVEPTAEEDDDSFSLDEKLLRAPTSDKPE